MPLELLWHGGATKAPLRAVLHRHVPPELIERPKQGFGIPIGTLLERELAEWRGRYLAADRLREEGHLRPEGIDPMLAAARQRGGPEGEVTQLWRLLCFQRWFARHHGAG
jgi:asparagine synthase (glutamine-hydrolysing)